MNSQPPTGLPLQLLLPLLAGVVYVAAVLLLKRAADLGADVWRTARTVNFTSALFFAPLALLGGIIPSWHLCWQPAVIAALFVSGQLFTLLALNTGDVSVATPVLGVKIPLVALLTSALIGERIGTGLWVATLLSSAALALLNFTRGSSHHRVGATILLATLAASSYALVDVLVQKWSPAWGAGRLLPVMMALAAVYSLALRPYGAARLQSMAQLPAGAAGWIAGGAACFALQGLLIVSSIALYGQATVANCVFR